MTYILSGDSVELYYGNGDMACETSVDGFLELVEQIKENLKFAN